MVTNRRRVEGALRLRPSTFRQLSGPSRRVRLSSPVEPTRGGAPPPPMAPRIFHTSPPRGGRERTRAGWRIRGSPPCRKRPGSRGRRDPAHRDGRTAPWRRSGGRRRGAAIHCPKSRLSQRGCQRRRRRRIDVLASRGTSPPADAGPWSPAG